MRAKILMLLALAAACGSSDNGGAGASDGTLFVPEGLISTELSGDGEGLTLLALTLIEGASGPELYAAVRNDGDTPACDAGMMVHFIDHAEQLLGSWGGSLRSTRLYRVNDGSGAIIPCVAPGAISMTGSADLPDGVVIDEIGSLQHTFPAFTVDVAPVAPGIVLRDVTHASGSYTGMLDNGLDLTISDATVSVFPVNRVGRPLGMATASAPADIAPGETWTFQTTSVTDPGVDHAAYATVGFLP